MNQQFIINLVTSSLNKIAKNLLFASDLVSPFKKQLKNVVLHISLHDLCIVYEDYKNLPKAVYSGCTLYVLGNKHLFCFNLPI